MTGLAAAWCYVGGSGMVVDVVVVELTKKTKKIPIEGMAVIMIAVFLATLVRDEMKRASVVVGVVVVVDIVDVSYW